MSRASRRARGRQLEAARTGGEEVSSLVGATRQIGALKIGLKENSIAVDASKLEAPQQVYDADASWLNYRSPGVLSLFFAKRSRVDSKVLESCLEIRYPPEDFVNTFWKVSETFFERLVSYVKQWPETAVTSSEAAPTNLPALKSHSDWATFTYMSHSGTEATFDFYHLSTAAIARFAQTKSVEGMRLRPIVRVQLTTFEMLALVEQSRVVVEKIMSVLPDSHRREHEAGDKRKEA